MHEAGQSAASRGVTRVRVGEVDHLADDLILRHAQTREESEVQQGAEEIIVDGVGDGDVLEAAERVQDDVALLVVDAEEEVLVGQTLAGHTR